MNLFFLLVVLLFHGPFLLCEKNHDICPQWQDLFCLDALFYIGVLLQDFLTEIYNNLQSHAGAF